MRLLSQRHDYDDGVVTEPKLCAFRLRNCECLGKQSVSLRISCGDHASGEACCTAHAVTCVSVALLAHRPHTRRELRAATGVLLVLRPAVTFVEAVPGQPPFIASDADDADDATEVLVALWSDGSVTALTGRVDLGTGLRTALAQIVAEELNVAIDSVHVVLGDTDTAPNQGPTIASASLQIHAAPLRAAAAQIAAWLAAQGSTAQSLARFLHGRHVELWLDVNTPTKPISDYVLVGQSVPRVDIPAKAKGHFVFVHDMRLPDMLHGRVIRPPYAGVDHGDFIGNTLESVDERSIEHIPGVRAVVVIRDFVGVVAEREEQAEQAMRELKVNWRAIPALTDVGDIEHALRTNSATARRLVDDGNVDVAIDNSAQPMPRTYLWPYQLHGSIGPSCAVADWSSTQLAVWSGTQNPHVLRADLARLMGLRDVQVIVTRLEAAGCYGRNSADDVTADAALLSRAVAAPVRVQLTRAQEHQWEPKGAAQLMDVRGGLNADGSPAAYDFNTSYPSNASPTLALLLTRTIEPNAASYEMGDRTARPPYAFEHLRVTVNDMPPLLRASWLRGVSALPNSFAHESYIDELATAAGVDPVQYRLRYLHDSRASELIAATAAKAGWIPRTTARKEPSKTSDIVTGQGFAYARYSHSKWPGFGAAWSAWVADVEVNTRTGDVHVKRVVVGHDAGLLVNPAGVTQQIHGNVIQTTSRALKERVESTPELGVIAKEWGEYPLLSFRDVPVIEVMHMPRPFDAPLGAGESSSVPGTAAIANAIFDATGVRFRQPPFTPEVIRAGLGILPVTQPAPMPQDAVTITATNAPWPRNKKWFATAGAFGLGAASVFTAMTVGRASIEPLVQNAARMARQYSDDTLERGQQLAALGNCAGCHTASNGAVNAGGLALNTPFGTIYSTNLTPDAQTGIGQWSLQAFTRAMREGISRDGHYLYPAFPFTSYAKTSDEDMQALYAYLMAQSPVVSVPPANQLRFPYNQRNLLAGWNQLFNDSAPYVDDGSRSSVWNRGAYLVTGLGHCGACHSPRNAMGAELSGEQHLSGAMIDGWHAPALTARSASPVPWTEASLFDYLRNGFSPEHGIAGGSMTQVVKSLAAVPDDDIRAMANYLASFSVPQVSAPEQLARTVNAAKVANVSSQPHGERLFEGACSGCHHSGDGPKLLGQNISLALATSLHADNPNNLIRTIFEGVRAPAHRDIGFMAGFRDHFNDEQMVDLVRYLRERFAPDKNAWAEVPGAVSSLRSVTSK
jgi:nicotinate dehydrogenase subunit B